MTKEGTVTKTENGFATVLVKTQNACDACRAECGGHCDKARLEAVTVENKINAETGDRVLLYSDTKTVMLWAVLVFILPILACFLTVIPIYFYTSSPIVLTLTGLITFFGVFAILKFIFRNKKDSDVFVIKKILKGARDNENS